MSVEIYIDDLKPDIQRQVLEELGLETAEELQKMGIMILSLFSAQRDRNDFWAAHDFLVEGGGQTHPHFYIHYEE